jgi:hypothetical protein
MIGFDCHMGTVIDRRRQSVFAGTINPIGGCLRIPKMVGGSGQSGGVIDLAKLDPNSDKRLLRTAPDHAAAGPSRPYLRGASGCPA